MPIPAVFGSSAPSVRRALHRPYRYIRGASTVSADASTQPAHLCRPYVRLASSRVIGIMCR